MPRRNTRRRLLPGIYHVYNRARDGRMMFIDDADRDYFLDLFKRYLSIHDYPGARAKRFPSLRMKTRLITFALMSTHFHLVVFQVGDRGLDDLMGRVLMSYVKYFNRRHGVEGPMFEGEYRADHKRNLRSQLNAIAYVHENHGEDCRCRYCGHRYFIGPDEDIPTWLGAAGGRELFGGIDGYHRFRRLRRETRELAGEPEGW